MTSLPIFSSLVNSEFDGADSTRLETELLGEPKLSADDHKKFIENFSQRLKQIENTTGVSMTPGPSHETRSHVNVPSRREPPREYAFSPKAPAPVPISSSFGGSSFAELDDDDSDDSDDTDDTASVSSTSSGSSRGGDGMKRSLTEDLHRLNLEDHNPGTGPRDKMSIDDMLLDIDIYRHSLVGLGEDLSNVPNVTARSGYHDVYRVHQLLSALYASKHYTTLFADVVLSGTKILETVFDGNLKVLGKYPISYRGLTRTLNYKFTSNARAVANASTKIANRIGVSPETVVLLDLMLPFLTVPIKNMGGDGGPVTNPNMAQVLGGM
jgi:hypothetical protein